MAKARTITYDTHDVVGVLKQLRGMQGDLRKQTNAELRDAAGTTATKLVAVYQSSASGTPQAALVASSARVKRDRIPSVSIGGSKRVGHRRTQAGAILWGSEHGGRNFAAARNLGGYWIEPLTRAFGDGPAVDAYRRAVATIIRKHGL
jgi:hypothetical protein